MDLVNTNNIRQILRKCRQSAILITMDIQLSVLTDRQEERDGSKPKLVEMCPEILFYFKHKHEQNSMYNEYEWIRYESMHDVEHLHKTNMKIFLSIIIFKHSNDAYEQMEMYNLLAVRVQFNKWRILIVSIEEWAQSTRTKLEFDKVDGNENRKRTLHVKWNWM